MKRRMVVTINMRTIFDCQDIWTIRKRTIDDEDCSLSIGAMPVSSLTTDTDIAFHSPLPKSFTNQQGDESICYQT